MAPSQVPGGSDHGVPDASAELRAAALFKLIWDSIAEMLGTTATAILLQRAARRATLRNPELGEFQILRTATGYTYALPRALIGKVESTPGALRALFGELRPLLIELTGNVVLGRLEQNPALLEREIVSPATPTP